MSHDIGQGVGFQENNLICCISFPKFLTGCDYPVLSYRSSMRSRTYQQQKLLLLVCGLIGRTLAQEPWKAFSSKLHSWGLQDIKCGRLCTFYWTAYVWSETAQGVSFNSGQTIASLLVQFAAFLAKKANNTTSILCSILISNAEFLFTARDVFDPVPFCNCQHANQKVKGERLHSCSEKAYNSALPLDNSPQTSMDQEHPMKFEEDTQGKPAPPMTHLSRQAHLPFKRETN